MKLMRFNALGRVTDIDFSGDSAGVRFECWLVFCMRLLPAYWRNAWDRKRRLQPTGSHCTHGYFLSPSFPRGTQNRVNAKKSTTSSFLSTWISLDFSASVNFHFSEILSLSLFSYEELKLHL